MRKFLTVCLWLGLVISVFTMISLTGSNNTLRAEARSIQRRQEGLQTKLDQAREELKEEQEGRAADEKEWQAVKDNLEKENAALAKALTEAEGRLESIRQDAEDRLTREQAAWAAEKEALTAEKDAAAGRLSDVMALLLPQEEEQEQEKTYPSHAGIFTVIE